MLGAGGMVFEPQDLAQLIQEFLGHEVTSAGAVALCLILAV